MLIEGKVPPLIWSHLKLGTLYPGFSVVMINRDLLVLDSARMPVVAK